MTRREQARFLRELTGSILKDGVALAKAGKFPKEWNGIELRWWLAARFEAATMCVAGEPYRRRLLRAFRNEVLVRNL